jgi:hypothetical protein
MSYRTGDERHPMSQVHCVEIELDDHFYEALLGESEKLHVDIEQLIERAAAAWVTDMEEGESA